MFLSLTENTQKIQAVITTRSGLSHRIRLFRMRVLLCLCFQLVSQPLKTAILKEHGKIEMYT